MTTLFTRNPRLSFLALLLILATGVASVFTMGQQEDPTLVERYAIVVTQFPGASAERVEALVTEPLENRILELSEVREIESTSRAGASIVTVELREDLNAAQVDQAWSLVRDQVGLARQTMPADVGPTIVNEQYIGAATMIVALKWDDARETDLGVITRLARDLQDRLQAMDGTEETRLYGQAVEEVRVVADPDKLAALGLTAGDVAARLAAADAKAPAGQVRASAANLGVEIAGELVSLDRVRETTILQDQAGRSIRVADILDHGANVERGWRTPAEAMAVVDGDRAILVGAFLQPGLRVDRWTADARDVVDAFRSELPDGVVADTIFEQNAYVETRIIGLAGTMLYSALIVFTVVLVLMGWRAALIVGSALPLTVLMVVTLNNFIGTPLHQMSVTGMVIALGLLIDNAIVMVDEYRLKRTRGFAPVEAVHQSVRELFAPLLASTVTTMLAFAPIALLTGSSGEFVSSIGVSVIFAVGASLVLSLTLVPAFAAWFDASPAHNAKPRFWRDGLNVPPLTWAHRRLVSAVVRAPALGVAIGLAMPVAGVIAATTLPMQFFPPTERDMFQMEIELPATSSIEETRRVVERANALLAEYPEIDHVGWVIGDQPPRTYYNVTGQGNAEPNFAAGWVRTTDAEATARIVRDMQARVREEFPQARFLVLPFNQGPPVPAPLEIILYGPDFNTLDELGEQVRLIMAQSENVTYTSAGLRLGAPVARIEADEAAVALSGRTLTQIAGLVRDDLDGALGGSVLEGPEELPVRVILGDRERASLEAVRAKPLPVVTAPGAAAPVGPPTPLTALGEVTLSPEVAVITRNDAKRSNRIFGHIEPFTLPDEALQDFLARLEAADFTVPPGYDVRIGGDAEQSGNAITDLLGTAGPLVILIMASLVLAFNSFRYGGVVALVGVQSVGLAFLGLYMFGQPNGFVAITGIMGLVGLAINGSIVVLSALRHAPDAVAGDRVAIVNTTMDATRHIVATTLTTIGGFLPLILQGDPFWMPLATAIAGGVGGSAILALYFTPAVFAAMAGGRARRAARRERRQAQASEAGDAAAAPA